MTRLALALTIVAAALSAPAAAKDKDAGTAVQMPVAGVTAAGEKFAGTFTLLRFATDDAGKVVAVGTIAGSITNAAGEVVATGLQTVALPAAVNGDAATAVAVAPRVTASCSILHLDLGPIALDLLGLQVNLSRVVLDISAVPGAGNLLGNLLCAVTNVLNNPSALVQLLNQILAALQTL